MLNKTRHIAFKQILIVSVNNNTTKIYFRGAYRDIIKKSSIYFERTGYNGEKKLVIPIDNSFMNLISKQRYVTGRCTLLRSFFLLKFKFPPFPYLTIFLLIITNTYNNWSIDSVFRNNAQLMKNCFFLWFELKIS